MQRGFLVRKPKPSRNVVSQHVASKTRVLMENPMYARAVFLLATPALADLTHEAAVLWLCRDQKRKEAVLHDQAEQKAKEDRFAKVLMDELASPHPLLQPIFDATGISRLAACNDEAERRSIIKDLRKQATRSRKVLGWA